MGILRFCHIQTGLSDPAACLGIVTDTQHGILQIVKHPAESLALNLDLIGHPFQGLKKLPLTHRSAGILFQNQVNEQGQHTLTGVHFFPSVKGINFFVSHLVFVVIVVIIVINHDTSSPLF